MKCTKAIISTMLSVIFLLWGGTFVVHAEEPVYVQEAEETSLVGANGLSLSVNYPSDIKCGVPITFTMNAGGGSGNYKYRIAGLMDSERNNVYDISFGSNGAYKTSNTFTFTFFASGTYYIRFSVMDMSTYQTLMTGMFDYPIVINDASHPSVETIVNSVAAQCEAVCQTDYEKALWLHDWIIDNADYDFSYSYCSAEGVLARGVGTCESYHGAYVKLLNRVGIETGRITGNGHVWTAVKLDGEWYQVDTTWDDKGAQFQGTFYEHLYFGVNDAIISLVHDEHQNPKPGYESTSLKNNYFIKTGQIKQWSDPFLDTIRQNIAAGQTEFRIPVTDSLHDSYKNVIYNLVAYQLSQENWNEKDVTVTYAERQLTCSVTNKENAGAGSTPGAGNNAGTGSTPGADNNAGTGSTPGADNNTGTGSTPGADNNTGTGSIPGADNNTGTGSAPGAGSDWVDNFEGKQKFAALLYGNALGREAEVSEVGYWEEQLSRGREGAEVAYGFLFSEEFKNHNYDNSDYVEHLYLSLMGRPSDAGGKAGWVAHLDNGVSRVYVFKQFIDSSEFDNLCNTYGISKGTVDLTEARDQNYDVARFVARNYSQFLGRGYDEQGLNDWCGRINNRTQTMQEIAFGFVFSSECEGKNLSDREFVEMLYRGCFDREGDVKGVNGWVEDLGSGQMDRQDVFWGFANSQEFANMVQSYGL